MEKCILANIHSFLGNYKGKELKCTFTIIMAKRVAHKKGHKCIKHFVYKLMMELR